MKKIVLTSLITGIGLLLLTGCKKNENTNEDGSPDLATFKVVMNGSTYTPTISNKSNSGGVITYQAQIGLNTNFTLQISDTLAPGTYPITDALPFRVFHSDDGNNTFYFGTSGSVTIVAHDQSANKIKGTFQATLTRSSPAGTKDISSGEFNFSY